MKSVFVFTFVLFVQTIFGQSDAGITTIVNPTGNICPGSTIPVVTLENFGSTVLTSVDVLYNIDGGTNATYVWSENLVIGSTIAISLPSISTTVGAHVFNATTSSPNGTTDNNMANDASSSNFTITPAINYTASVTNTNCGDSTGSIVISANGGTGSLQYSIDGGTTLQTSNSFSSLSLGSYNIVVEDANGCQKHGIENVLSNGGPSIIVATGANPTCFGTNNGTIVIAAAAPTTGFTYSINGGLTYSTQPFFQNLSPGTYPVFLKDSTGCQTFTSVTLIEPPKINTIIFGNNASCNSSNGSVSVLATGGDGNFSYLWNDPANQTSSAANGLPAGFYHVIVTDGGGCAVSDSVFVGNNGGPNVSLVSTNALCQGDANGEISTSVGGGTPPYFYFWNDATNQTNATATGLPVGTYLVKVTDNNGCVGFGSTSIAEPELLTGMLSNVPTTCGVNNGVAIATIQGGVLPYSYLWDDSNSQINQVAVNLAAGQYSVQVTDGNGCFYSGTTLVTLSDSLRITPVIKHESCIGTADGNIEITVSGGVAPYTVNWNSGDTSTVLNAISSGNYSVQVTDNSGCTAVQTITLLTESMECLIIPTAFSPNADGKNDFWVIEGLDVTAENQVEIYNRWGVLLYQNSAYQNDWDGTSNNKNVPGGGYFYIVTISGKTYSGSLAIIR